MTSANMPPISTVQKSAAVLSNP